MSRLLWTGFATVVRVSWFIIASPVVWTDPIMSGLFWPIVTVLDVFVCPSMRESLGVISHVQVSPFWSSCETIFELELRPSFVSTYLWFICACERHSG